LAKLAQTYLHLKVHASEEGLADARAYFEYIAALSASDHFKREVDLEFRIEDGSLKGWITVFGGLYAGICAYGSFREGIDYAVKDARAFSEYVIERVANETDMPQHALFRSERRLGLPGRIQRLYPLLDETSDLIKRGYNTPAHQHLDQVQEQIRQIAADLDAPDDKNILDALEASIPVPVRKRLPEPIPTMPIHVAQVLAIKDENHTTRGKPKDLLRRYPKPPKPPRFR